MNQKNKQRLYENIINDVSKTVGRKMYENFENGNYALYEDIMNDVSKVVKKRVNEEAVNDMNLPEKPFHNIISLLINILYDSEHLKEHAVEILTSLFKSNPNWRVWDEQSIQDALYKISRKNIPCSKDARKLCDAIEKQTRAKFMSP